MSKVLHVALVIILFPGSGFAKGFFDQRYRGWLWFEEKQQDEGDEAYHIEESSIPGIPTREEVERAKLENEQFREDLENLRHLVIRYPANLDYIRLYKEKEKQMLTSAIILANNFAMVNFLNPDLANQLETPQNIYGRNVAKLLKEQRNRQIIKQLANKVELFVFRRADCAHCPLLEKHLNTFAGIYGFKVEAVSQDNSTSSYFKTHYNPAIISRLALDVMPAVIAILRDSSQRFELARGAVSIPDLEDRALLLARFLNNQSKHSAAGKQ